MDLNFVVSAADSEVASERTVLALGEAKAGEQITTPHLRRLEDARTAMGEHAAESKLLLFGVDFSPKLVATAARRADVELVDLERLYAGP